MENLDDVLNDGADRNDVLQSSIRMNMEETLQSSISSPFASIIQGNEKRVNVRYKSSSKLSSSKQSNKLAPICFQKPRSIQSRISNQALENI